jgi:glycosyltransferase involved in cell wall biosynthesis
VSEEVTAATMLRVCILTETYHPVVGGGETQARLLAERLSAGDVSVCVLTRRSDAALPRVERIDGVPVHRVPPVGRGHLRKWGLLVSTVPALFRLRREYHLVLVSGFRIVGVPAMLVSRMLGKRVVLKADSQGEMSGAFFAAGLSRFGMSASSPVFRMFIRLRNAVLRGADGFVAISPDIATELTDAGVPLERIHPIPNGVDTSRFVPADSSAKAKLRRELGLEDACGVVVYTGRLVSYKGLPVLLRVWPAILREHPAARLLLVGGGGLDIHDCEQELKGYVRANGLEHSVVFTGNVQNVPDYLRAADVFAFPTENEAFGSSLVEAMCCGLAVVTTPVGAIRTIVEDGQNGLVIQPGAAGELECALKRLLSDRALATRLGGAAHRCAVRRYSAEFVTRQYLELFQSIAGRKDSASSPADVPASVSEVDPVRRGPSGTAE